MWLHRTSSFRSAKLHFSGVLCNFWTEILASSPFFLLLRRVKARSFAFFGRIVVCGLFTRAIYIKGVILEKMLFMPKNTFFWKKVHESLGGFRILAYLCNRKRERNAPRSWEACLASDWRLVLWQISIDSNCSTRQEAKPSVFNRLIKVPVRLYDVVLVDTEQVLSPFGVSEKRYFTMKSLILAQDER